MKILTISNLYPPNAMGGAEILTKNLVDVLHEHHQVFVLTSSCSQSFPSHVLPDLRRWDPDNPPAFFTRLSISLENKIISKKVLKKINPDVVLISDLKGLGYAPLRVAQKTKPTVTFLHDHYAFAEARPDSTRSRSIVEHIRKFAAGLLLFGLPIRLNHAISNSRTTLKKQPPFAIIKESTIVRVGIPKPIGPDDISWHERTPNNRKQILYLGRIVEEKGVHLVIKALKFLHTDLRVDNIHLNIVGFAHNPNYLAMLKNLVVQFDLGEHVHFRGSVEEEKKYQFYYEADVFVFPSIWEEGLGQTYLEAMSCGLPCVCSPAGGAKEILKNEVNCLLFEPSNIPQLAQAIHRILTEEALRTRIIQQAHQMVEQEFYMTEFAQRCLTVIENCARQH